MTAFHIHEALAQVREIKRRVIDRQYFRGYSGRARAIGGTLALLTAAILAMPAFPQTEIAHLFGWGTLLVVALILNYVTLTFWFLFDPDVKRDMRRLRPMLDAFPPFFVAGVISLVLLIEGHSEYLFGAWMSLFGLANFAIRHTSPDRTWLVGAFYMLAGTFFLLFPGGGLANPWPMGIVFFLGEWAGGLIFFFGQNPGATLLEFFDVKIKAKANEHGLDF